MAWANQHRRSDESRRAILDAALELSREAGFEAVSIEAVARRAGAGKQTIYRWWPSKGVLVLDAVIAHARDSDEFPDTGDVIADLTAQMVRVARLMSSPDSGPLLMGLLGAAQHDTALAERLDSDLLGPRREACLVRLRAAAARGELAPDTDVTMLMEQLYGLLYYRSLVVRKVPSLGYVRRHVRDLLERHAARG